MISSASRAAAISISTHAPAGGATRSGIKKSGSAAYFYSRPCGRGDSKASSTSLYHELFLLTPLREGRRPPMICAVWHSQFLLTPLREGRRRPGVLRQRGIHNFYSRPCGRGGSASSATLRPATAIFLLPPLREGRPGSRPGKSFAHGISTHAPAGGATKGKTVSISNLQNFYSRPCGRGDMIGRSCTKCRKSFLLTPLREGRRRSSVWRAATPSFLLTPLREGRPRYGRNTSQGSEFLLTPLREGRPSTTGTRSVWSRFLLTPLREGRPPEKLGAEIRELFLLTPLREGRLCSLL